MSPKLFLALIALVLFSIPAKADPTVITSGTVTRTGESQVSWSIAGAGFLLVGGTGSSSWPPPCSPCSVGTNPANSTTGNLANYELGLTTATLNGIQYINDSTFPSPPSLALPYVSMSGGMGFLATAVIVQSLDSVVTVTTPFTMTGGFQGFSSTGGFSVNMTGSGILTLELNHAPGGGIFQFRKATYTFQTPEPSTVVLLITGLLGIIVLRKKIASHGS